MKLKSTNSPGAGYVLLVAFVVVALQVLPATVLAMGSTPPSKSPSNKSVPLTILYSGNMDGELEPCGCSDEGNLGGLKRRTTTIDTNRKQHPDMILISSGGLIANEGANDNLKSTYILKAFAKLDYDAIGVQWRDLAFGVDYALQEKLPWVASNWNNDKFAKAQTITRTIDGVKVSFDFFTWLDPDSSPSKEMQGEHADVSEKVDNLNKAIAASKAKNVITILTTTLPFDIVKEGVAMEKVDIFIERSAYEVYSEPRKVGATLVLQPGSRGMRLGKLQLEVKNSAIESWQHEIISMPDKVPDSERMLAWYDEYNAKVKEDYLKRVAIRKQRESGESPYVGEEVCKNCHPKQHKVWQDSEHAIAYEDLEAVGKSFDPECIVCHTVAFNKPGGFVDMSITSHLLGVQCENCHGAGAEHAKTAGAKPVANKGWSKDQMCGQCHTQPHSPSFSVQKYWPKIQH